LDVAGILGDDPAATFFRFGKAGRVRKQIFETGSQIQLALIKHGQNADEQKRFPLTRSPFAPITLSPPGRGEGQGGAIIFIRVQPSFIRS
jgi:hypothetical protein